MSPGIVIARRLVVPDKKNEKRCFFLFIAIEWPDYCVILKGLEYINKIMRYWIGVID